MADAEAVGGADAPGRVAEARGAAAAGGTSEARGGGAAGGVAATRGVGGGITRRCPMRSLARSLGRRLAVTRAATVTL